MSGIWGFKLCVIVGSSTDKGNRLLHSQRDIALTNSMQTIIISLDASHNWRKWINHGECEES